MTALLVRAATPVVAADVVGEAEDRPLVDSPTTPSTGRDYFPGEAVYVEAPYVAMVGPLTATPGLTLADVVKAIAG